MCGLVAILSRDAPIRGEALRDATAALRHRGPDGERTWTAADGRVGLGHTRLALIDPTGHQPIASEDDQCRIVVNGELYDFERIRADLERRGHRFRTRSDSEIALHLYEDLGTGCLEHLRGEFAFVLWDARNQTLLAARDRFGIRPLFYAETREALYLASEAKALFAAGLPAAWDAEGLFHTLHACPLEERSLFAEVRQVPPGGLLIARNGSLRIERYWDVRPPGRTKVAEAQCIESVRGLLDEAVRLRLRADVPVGCLLSGGLDSSSTLGLAAVHTTRPVTAFTIGFGPPEYDESAGALEMARHVGADLRIVRVGDRDLADHFGAAVRHAEMVQYNAHGTARYLLSRAVREAGYKAVLAGEGADEVFFGYEFLRAALPANGRGGRWRGRLRLATRLLGLSRRTNPDLALVSPWLARIAALVDLSPDLLTRLTGGVRLLRASLVPDFLRPFERHDAYRAFYRRCQARTGLSRWEPARQLVYLWLRSIFANYHLAADRLDMAHGVEVRLPFLDHVLFDYTNGLPLGVLANGGQEKLVLREAMRPYISDGVYRRVKKPFWAPPAASRDGNALHELTQDTLRGAGLGALPFLDRSAIARLLDRLPVMADVERASVDPLLMMLVSLCLLNEAFGCSS
jgi:asparagine synthase (glutamine-hydrolysing)